MCLNITLLALGFPATALGEEVWGFFMQANNILVELLEDQRFGLGAPDCL